MVAGGCPDLLEEVSGEDDLDVLPERQAAEALPSWPVALLRSVGHVLEKVDGKQEPVTTRAINDAWKRWQDDPAAAIFREFIEPERNMVLKEYEFGRNAPAYLLLEGGGRILLEDGSGALLLEQPDISRVDEALEWWERELAAIEADISLAQ